MYIPKFRAWTGKKMIYSNESAYTPFNDSEGVFPDVIIRITHENYGWIWMLGAGINDINNKDIYDGDIIRDKYNNIYVVDLNESGIGYGFKPFNDPENLTTEWEIIGNKYENPELLINK